jgi:hypothetical protein
VKLAACPQWNGGDDTLAALESLAGSRPSASTTVRRRLAVAIAARFPASS